MKLGVGRGPSRALVLGPALSNLRSRGCLPLPAGILTVLTMLSRIDKGLTVDKFMTRVTCSEWAPGNQTVTFFACSDQLIQYSPLCVSMNKPPGSAATPARRVVTAENAEAGPSRQRPLTSSPAYVGCVLPRGTRLTG